MKIFIVLLIAFNILNAQTEVQFSNLELSRHQVLGLESINNNLYVVSFGGQGSAILDVIDMDKNTIKHDILKNSGESITFGNSNLFKDKTNNLWIGDINRLIKITENGEIFNIYKGVDVPDSTYFEIKAITQDNDNNLYFLKMNYKVYMTKKEGNTNYSTVVADVEIVKFDGVNIESLTKIKDVGPIVEDIYYYKNKLYCSMLLLGNKTPKLYTYDLSNQKFELTNFSLPSNIDMPDLAWEKAKMATIESIFEFNNELYFNVLVDASMSWFNCFAKYNEKSDKFEYFTLPRDEKNDEVLGFTSFEILNDRLFCAGFFKTGKRRSFFEYKNDKYTEINFENEIQPYILTASNVKSEIISRNLKFESGEFGFSNDMHINNQGNLYAGTAKGLIYIENFFQNTSSVKQNEIKIMTYPDISNVKGELYLESEFAIKSYKLIDLNSKVILSNSNLNSNTLNLNLENLSTGIYFVVVETQHGSKSLKINKN